jgi:hypothetical protein
MDERMHQEALRVDGGVPLLALDLVAGVERRWVNRRPPFSALFTLAVEECLYQP